VATQDHDRPQHRGSRDQRDGQQRDRAKPRKAYLVTLTAMPQNSDAMISAASGSLVIIVALAG
jgi:hypothetical protein